MSSVKFKGPGPSQFVEMSLTTSGVILVDDNPTCQDDR